MNTTVKRFLTTAIAGAAAFGLASCSKEKAKDTTAQNTANSATKKLVITQIPDEKVADQQIAYQALADYLQKALNVPVELSISTDYDAAVTRFANNEVHLVWFGGLTGVQARAKVEGARAIAQGQSDPKFKSYFIANASTGLEPSDTFPQEIATMSFSFGSPKSTSGRLMPQFFIQQATGKSIDEFFTKPYQFQNSGGHVATANAVQKNSVQVGVLNYKTYDKLAAEGKIDPTVAKVIWVTPEYADYNFTAHPSLDKTFGAGFIDKLQQALVDCKDEKALSAINRKAIIKAENKDFDGIVEVAKGLGFLR